MSTQLFFFPFLFSFYFRSVDPRRSVLFMVAVISLLPRFSMSSSSRCIDASTLFTMPASHLPPSFRDIYRLSTSFLGCKALCIIITFLVLWCLCLSSSLVHFKNGPEYLMSGTALVFIPFISFLLYSLVLSSFLVHLRYSLKFFFLHHHLFDGVYFQYSQVFLRFLFSECSNFFWVGCSILSIMCRFSLFIISMAHFSRPNSIPISWLYILTACVRVFSSFSFLENSLMSSINIR